MDVTERDREHVLVENNKGDFEKEPVTKESSLAILIEGPKNVRALSRMQEDSAT